MIFVTFFNSRNPESFYKSNQTLNKVANEKKCACTLVFWDFTLHDSKIKQLASTLALLHILPQHHDFYNFFNSSKYESFYKNNQTLNRVSNDSKDACRLVLRAIADWIAKKSAKQGYALCKVTL